MAPLLQPRIAEFVESVQAAVRAGDLKLTERNEVRGAPGPTEEQSQGAARPPDEIEDFGEMTVVSLDELEPDFTGDSGDESSMQASEDAEPWFPPTDPVIVPERNDAGGASAVGEASPVDEDRDLPGDEGDDGETLAITDDEITEAVYYALRADGQTLDLPVQVLVANGIVTLRGNVRSLEDAEAAEAVAGRVEGVVEVQEELTVQSR